MANVIDDEFEAWVKQRAEDRAWWENWDPGDEWATRYGPAVIELFQGWFDNNAFAEFAATPEGRRIYAYGERWRAKQPSQPRRARAPYKPSLASRLKAAHKAGAKDVDIKPDGTVTAAYGTEPIPNEWDADLGIAKPRGH